MKNIGNKMKNFSKALFLAGIIGIGVTAYGNAEFSIEIDTGNTQVYLASWDKKVTIDDLDILVTKKEKESESSKEVAIDFQETTWSWENLTWNTSNTFTWNTQTWENISGTGESLITSGNTLTWTDGNTTGSNNPSYVTIQTPNQCEYSGIVLDNLQTGTELEKAIYWMYRNGLTSFNTLSGYRPYDKVTREESAKLIWQLYHVLWFTETDKGWNCNFIDTDKFDPTLKDHIKNVCTWGIFQGNPNTQEFMPHDELTKGQTLTVLIRILEDKLSDESIQPRRLEYYVKAKIIGITNEKNLQKMEMWITREEIALLIYRYKNLLIKPNGCNNKEQVTSKISGNINAAIQQVAEDWNQDVSNTGLLIDNIWTIDLELLAGNTSLSDDPEFKEAINWMYDHGITNYKTPDEYLPFQSPTREQIAKMIDKFATAMNLNTIRNTDCDFTDIENSEMKESIIRVCQLGVMGGIGNEFRPEGSVKKSDFITILIRLFEGRKLDEKTEPRWLNYYQRAIDLSLISAQDTVTFDKEIARYEVAVFLYRLKVRLTMYNNLNNTMIPDEIIKTLEDTTQTWAKQTANISVDLLALNNQNFSEGFIEIFGTRYKIKKTVTDAYNVWENSFVRYGSISDFVTNENVGIINFIITNKALTEGSVRLLKDDKSYKITKDEQINSYYYLTQI